MDRLVLDLPPESQPFAATQNPGPETASAVTRLVTEYFLRTDRPEFGDVAELFMPDGVLQLGATTIEGRDAIAAFFAERNGIQAASGRTTRHFSGPLAFRAHVSGAVKAHATVIVFAGTGALPLMSGPPSNIVDFDDVFARDQHGAWRFTRRKVTALFAGANAPSFAR